jgi:hypothetical protein
MFRTRAKYNDKVHRQIQQQAYAFLSSQTHTANPRYSATPTWKSVSRQKLSIIHFYAPTSLMYGHTAVNEQWC